MSSVALRAISIVVGIFFVFFGTLKLAPIFSEDLYRSTRKVFVKIYGPFLFSRWTGWSPSPHMIRRIYGSIEVVGGLTLAACSGLIQDLSAGVLLGLMLFNVLSIWNAAEGLKDASNSIVFGLLLTCRFVIRAQLAENAERGGSTEEDLLRQDIRRRVAMLRKELKEVNDFAANKSHELSAADPKGCLHRELTPTQNESAKVLAADIGGNKNENDKKYKRQK